MKIIFHHPLPLNPNAKSASGIRPLRMLEAFRRIGYEVNLVVGYAAERARAIAEIRRNVQSGVKYDFVYSESSTMPTILTEKHHLPLHPLLDRSFFQFCKGQNIPIGVFYRDIYWRFESYGRDLNPVKRWVAKAAYSYELNTYKHTLNRLFLPSSEMTEYVPLVQKSIMTALPPGHDGILKGAPSKRNESKPLKLFYVGGMSDHYQLHKLFEAVADLPRVELTICTREDEWNKHKREYRNDVPNIRIVHKTGKAMNAELRRCDIAALFVQPQEYREFASPVKLYEYLGEQKPILVSKGTLAGKFVEENKIGWSIPYEVDAVKSLLERLAYSSEEFEPICVSLARVAPLHTWEARARRVAEVLVK